LHGVKVDKFIHIINVLLYSLFILKDIYLIGWFCRNRIAIYNNINF